MSPDNHHLSVFGGAGGQHACDIATNLGIQTVIIHKYSSILSAYGMEDGVSAKMVTMLIRTRDGIGRRGPGSPKTSQSGLLRRRDGRDQPGL